MESGSKGSPTMEPESNELPRRYTATQSISSEKFKHLQVLKKFCSPSAQTLFEHLPTATIELDSNYSKDSD